MAGWVGGETTKGGKWGRNDQGENDGGETSCYDPRWPPSRNRKESNDQESIQLPDTFRPSIVDV